MDNKIRKILLIGGSMNGEFIHLKYGNHIFEHIHQKDPFERPEIETYSAFFGLDKVFTCDNEPMEKHAAIIQELILQGLQNGQ